MTEDYSSVTTTETQEVGYPDTYESVTVTQEHDFLASLKSRKFVLTILFAAVMVANKALGWGLSDAELMTLAGIIGIYNVANAIDIKTR